MKDKKSVAILCSGGPAPGINTVVCSIAKVFLKAGYRVIGINYGTKTLFTDKVDTVEIDFERTERYFNRGGSFLKMSRYKPKDSEFKPDFFIKNNVELLVTIGGDDTASTANRITKYLNEKNLPVRNIHVPKTIDNDLPLPEALPTFGYQSAQNEGVRIATTIYEDARTSGNWFVVSSMGREAGHLAFDIGVACHYPMIIIPEMFKNVEVTFDRIKKMMISSILKRKKYTQTQESVDMDYGAIMISEGVFHFMSDEEIIGSGIKFSFDEHGHPELGNISKAHIFNVLLNEELKKLDRKVKCKEKINLKVKCRPTELGYELRCCPPCAFDLKYCTLLGFGVKELFDRGVSGCIVVCNNDGKVSPLYLEDIEDPETGKIKPRLVNIETDNYKMMFENLQYINEDDYKWFSDNLDEDPQLYDLKHILGLKK